MAPVRPGSARFEPGHRRKGRVVRKVERGSRWEGNDKGTRGAVVVVRDSDAARLVSWTEESYVTKVKGRDLLINCECFRASGYSEQLCSPNPVTCILSPNPASTTCKLNVVANSVGPLPSQADTSASLS